MRWDGVHQQFGGAQVVCRGRQVGQLGVRLRQQRPYRFHLEQRGGERAVVGAAERVTSPSNVFAADLRR
ncbi:hypothetical protein [Polymorphospora rubra]|uniref:hypothetical protein n=1 Tax=Polymorphospora rubra TaxID=338584 RepID=UPI001BB43440|nr:hypothetical protein [Polymorphospora rubra]